MPGGSTPRTGQTLCCLMTNTAERLGGAGVCGASLSLEYPTTAVRSISELRSFSQRARNTNKILAGGPRQLWGVGCFILSELGPRFLVAEDVRYIHLLKPLSASGDGLARPIEGFSPKRSRKSGLRILPVSLYSDAHFTTSSILPHW